MTAPLFQSGFQSKQIGDIFAAYPDIYRQKLLVLRELIFTTATSLGIENLEETIKWGEPSYISQHGSVVRLAWQKSNPKQYGIFFNCKTSLVETFKEVYGNDFNFEGNRAIVFNEHDDIQKASLKHCIALSLNYKKLKHLPLLGL